MNRLLLFALWLGLLPTIGCSLTGKRGLFDRNDPDFVELPPEDGKKGLLGDATSEFRRLTGIKKKIDREGAKTTYQEAEAVFNAAAAMPVRGTARVSEFVRAAKVFKKAAKKWPESQLAQDAMFMAAEANFFADNLNDAEEIYSALMKEHPRNRFVSTIQKRKFEIGRYWMQVGTAHKRTIINPNFYDDKEPWTDTRGHGIRVLDKMRFDDPTGKLADDATMAGAVDLFEQKKYEQSEEWFSDLIQTFPDSPHQFKAHALAVRSKLNIYQGPRYTPDPLLDAEKLVDRMKRSFRMQLEADESMSKIVAEADAEIRLRMAERLAFTADYHEKRQEHGPATWYYARIIEKYSDTPYAEDARGKLPKLSGLPDMPAQRLAWLAKAFPEPEKQQPLVLSNAENLIR